MDSTQIQQVRENIQKFEKVMEKLKYKDAGHFIAEFLAEDLGYAMVHIEKVNRSVFVSLSLDGCQEQILACLPQLKDGTYTEVHFELKDVDHDVMGSRTLTYDSEYITGPSFVVHRSKGLPYPLNSVDGCFKASTGILAASLLLSEGDFGDYVLVRKVMAAKNIK